MRAATWLILALGSAAIEVRAADISAGPISELSITIYREPERASGSIDLDALGGFALISETRSVQIPPGVNRIRFEGVADGIEPASAIVVGFPDGVIEKNRDGRLLSPSALAAAAAGKQMTLLRTDRKTGRLTRTLGTILSDAEGVVFQTPAGIEALRCSGMPESFSFEGIKDLAATPTLSVLVHSSQAVQKTVTLSYLAHGFDWAADYVAILAHDGLSMDLGAWVTLVNGNGIGFPSAHTQVVAGRVNREDGGVEPVDAGGPILAQCWPRGSTSDVAAILQIAGREREERMSARSVLSPAAPLKAMDAMAMLHAQQVEQEQLADLKLYRVPDRTTVAARQSKQVRLMDRLGVPVTTVYRADITAQTAAAVPVQKLLRTTNDAANHLGLPLPSGHVAIFAARGGGILLEHESDLRDLAVDEEIEISLGVSPDVQVTATQEMAATDLAHARLLPRVPGVTALRSAAIGAAARVDIANAGRVPVQFELRLQLPAGGRVMRADHPVTNHNGRSIFYLTIPANGTMSVRYQTDRRATGRL